MGLLAFFGLLLALGSVLIGGAVAASPCAGGPRTSADGETLIGSACGDVLVVTSAHVRRVLADGGDDVVYANPNVEMVDGGDGDDVIYGELPETSGEAVASRFGRRAPGATGSALATASLQEVQCGPKTSEGKTCYGGDGSQELIGGSGNDKIFGQRGNDLLRGNAGNDQLFGGVGDECPSECAEVGISGGAGDDLLSGGLGTDNLNGNENSDLIRGDGTIDTLADTGTAGTDTLSFATAVAPGFHEPVSIAGFPADNDGAERGVYVRLDGAAGLCGLDKDSLPLESCNNDARYGGGSDHVNGGFENVIGSPFSDLIVGSGGANRIDGGGGADVIYGGAGSDQLYGGADGDYLKGDGDTDVVYGQGGNNNCDAETVNECSGVAESVTPREQGLISVGFNAIGVPGNGGGLPSGLNWVQLYLVGSTARDDVTINFSLVGGVGHVVFTTQGESAQFNVSANAKTAGCEYTATQVDCTLPKPTDAITIAGLGGNDRLSLGIAEQFWETTSPVLLGGEGADELFGTGYTEDMVVDGPGTGGDLLYAKGGDDALINNGGADTLQGGNGNDLLLSATNCDGDVLQGAESGLGDGEAVNSASWAKYLVAEGAAGVVADLETKEGVAANGKAGNVLLSARNPGCSAGSVGTLLNIDDLEGTSGIDQLYGDSKGNNMLGRPGKDEFWGRNGNDRIEADDNVIENGGGGGGTADVCDLDGNEWNEFAGCESKI